MKLITLLLLAASALWARSDQPGAAAGRKVEVKLEEWKIDMPATLPAGPTTLAITNAGKHGHNLKIEGEGIKRELAKTLKAGESATLDVDLKPGTYKVTCPVGLGVHKRKGMSLELKVTR
jgi:uncharacterized cupredoxin-like copper-binding protein